MSIIYHFLNYDGSTLYVEDIQNYCNSGITARVLHNNFGKYSAIYLDSNICNQPYLLSAQNIIGKWSKANVINNVLVLGSAAGAIPRFLLKTYPNVYVDGVEISNEIIEVAKKYFFFNLPIKRFNLIHDDAFKYVEQHLDIKYDIIVVDIFNDKDIETKINTLTFITSLLAITNQNALILFNVAGADNNFIQSISDTFHMLKINNVVHDNNVLCVKKGNS